MSKFVTIDVQDSLQLRLAELTQSIDAQLRMALDKAIADLAQAAYSKALEIAQSKLDSTLPEYREALKFEIIEPGVYSVSLDESAAHLESGYEGYDQRPGLLKNAKKVSREGFAYRSIPFKHGKGQSGSRGSMLEDLNRLRAGFGHKGIMKDEQGNPLLGKVGTYTRTQDNLWLFTGKQPGAPNEHQRFVPPELSKNLEGLSVYQYQTKTRSGKMMTRTSMLTFRTVSSNPKTFYDKDGRRKWWNSGFGGARVWDELVPWVQQQMDRILDNLLGPAI